MAFKPMLQFGTIVSEFDDQYAKAEERRRIELENQVKDTEISEKAARDAKAVTDQSIQSASVARQQQLDILGGIEGEIKKANRAIELGASENPMDRLTLWALQQADPSYTRDGNIRRIEYYQKAADAVGGIEALKQMGFQDQMTQIKSDAELALMENDSELALAKMMELQGQERIDAITNYTSQLSGMLSAQNNIQQQALMNVPDEAIDGAIKDAQNAPDKKANIGGVPISLAMLEERKLAITERKYLQTTRNRDLSKSALDRMDPKQVEEAEAEAAANGGIYTTPDGIEIAFNDLRERRAANLNFDYTQQVQAESMRGIDDARRRDTDKRLLDTFGTVELTQMLAGDGSDPKTGARFDKDQIQTALQQKQEAETKRFGLDFAVQSGQLTALPAKENIDYIDSLNVTPGSPLATALANQRKINQTAAGILGGDDANPENKLTMLQVTQGSRETIDAAIRAEATRLAGPTADKDIIALNEALIRRQPLETSVVEQIVTERGADPKKGLGGILSQEMNAVFVKARGDAYEALSNPSNVAAIGMSDKEKMAQATAYALEALTSAASGGLTERMFSQQASTPGNPLVGAGISGAQFMTISQQADEAGIKQYLDAGMVPDGMQKKDVTPEALRANPPPNLITMQQAHLMVELEKLKPGLAKQYTDWWASPQADKFMTEFMARENQSKKTVSDMMTWSLVAPSIPQQVRTYGVFALQGRETMVRDVIAKQHSEFMTFQGSVESKQAYLIDATPDMNDQDKKIGWTLIQPLLKKAKEQGFDMAQTNKWIEGQLAVMQAPSGDPSRVLKKMQAGRGDALATIERFNKAQPVNMSIGGMPGLMANTLMQAGRDIGLLQPPIDQRVARFDWLK